jgi:hypothetical protein
MNKPNLKLLASIGFVLLLVCSTNKSLAQSRDSLLQVYNNQTIRTVGKAYVKGSRQLSFGNLKPEFQNGVTKNLYKKAKGNRILSRFLTVTSVAALVTSAVIKKDNKGAALGLSIAGIAMNLGNLHFRKQSNELLDQAIWMRNREILFGRQ